MDIRTDFMELAALLTGVYNIANGPELRQLNESTADEYLRLLMGAFPDRLPKLLEAYDRLATAVPKPALDDDLLNKLMAQPELADAKIKFVARQIVNVWYFSQFSTNDQDPGGSVVDGGFFERGLVWSVVKAHPIGYSNQPFGYWTKQP